MKNTYQDFVDSHFGNILSQIEDSGRVVCITFLASLFTMAPVGYHMVAFNVPELIIQKHVNESFTNVFHSPLSQSGMSVFWSATIASQGLGALIGCAFVVPLSSWLGAKKVLTGVNNYLLLASSLSFIISYMLNLAPFLIIGRLFSGAYTGIGCAMLPLFVQEVAPKQIKGSLLCFMHIAVCLGSSASAVISLPFMLGGERTWWIHLAFPALFGIAQLVTGGLIPDTPNHLIQNGKYTAALQAIDFYYDINPENEDEAIRQYWDRVPQHESCVPPSDIQLFVKMSIVLFIEMTTQMSFGSAIRNPRVRWGCILGMIVSASQIFSGSMVSISYSTSMFNSVSFLDALVPFLPALGSIVSVLLTLPALQLVETSGRRPLLLKTLVICLVANICFLIFSLLSVNPEENWWASWLFGASFLIFGIGYNLGIGPVSYFIPSELVPPEAASAALGSAVAVNWLCTMFTTLIYYPLQHLIGGWSYLMFIIPCTIFLIFLWRFLPETRFYYHEHDELGASRSLTELDPILPYGTFERELVNGIDDDEQSLL